ncbi:MAG: outer membrane lipid asymmetry maintenance protein MlaD [Parvularculaceae bacterium]|nr:outer membrane lipid asymmetry maintenance protein MlaD [Parvularculaceae bacterium]
MLNRGAIFETLVGVVVLAAAAAFLWYAYGVTGAGAASSPYQVSAVFGRVDGVDIGADVKIAGVKIGTVTGSALDKTTYEARLQFAIDKGVGIPDDSAAKIKSDGFLGGAHVSIEPGASEKMLKDGGVITITQGSVDLLSLAVQAFTAGKSPQATGEEPAGTGQTEQGKQ